MPTHVLKFTPNELSKTAEFFLSQRFMQEDYESYWCSINGLLEAIEEGDLFTGVALPEGFNWKKKSNLTGIPKSWWTLMAFPKKVERAMKAFWKKNPEGEIEWKW